MTLFDPHEAALKSSAPQLARLLAPKSAEEAGWFSDDLPELLSHQWRAPIDFDLASVKSRDREKTLTRAASANVKTFGDLLTHPSPAPALLKLAKEFFKEMAGRARERSPQEQIGYLFYVLVILAAQARTGTSITSLSPGEVEKAVKWARAQTWVTGEAKSLLRELAPEERE
jgi:hypothetical protein